MQSRAWRDLRTRRLAVARAEQESCIACGKPVDYDLSGRHRWGPTVDHEQARAFGGGVIVGLADLRIMHMHCARRQGGQISQHLRRGRTVRRQPAEQPTEPGPVQTRIRSTTAVRQIALAKALDWRITGHDLPPPGPDANAPRLFSPRHPNAVGSYGPAAIDWIEDRSKKPLRWAQKIVIMRALEHDANRELCYREILYLMPRRGGKSVTLREVICWRCWSGHLGDVEPQVALHIAKDLKLARSTQAQIWDWAERRGMTVRKTNGQEAVSHPNGSMWQIQSHHSVYGHEGGLSMIDEGWAVSRETADTSLAPAQIGRDHPQSWIFSMPHRRTTDFVPSRRLDAIDPSNDIMLAEWSANPAADLDDPAVWLAAAPHLDAAYRRDILRACRNKPEGYREQWLGIWPDEAGEVAGWPAGWETCAQVVAGPPPRPPVAAIEQARDLSSTAVAIATGGPGAVHVWTAQFETLDEAIRYLRTVAPQTIRAGISLKAAVIATGLHVEAAGVRETGLAAPALADLIRRGVLAHDHRPEMAAQVDVCRVRETEAGLAISGRESGGPVHGVKAVAWAAWHLVTVPVAPRPMIFI